MLKVFLCSILIFFALLSFAQISTSSGRIAGKIIDEKQAPIDDVVVSLLRAKDSTMVRGTLPRADGTFNFEKVTIGSYLIAVTRVGHPALIKGPFEISNATSDLQVGTIQISPAAVQLKVVNIVGNKPLIELRNDKTVLNIENSALAAGNSAYEILSRAPGVSIDQSGNISLKGRQGVIILIDGKRSYLTGTQLASLLESTPGNSIKSVELIANPSAKYDAEGNSGVINIKLKKKENDGTNAEVRIGGGYGNYYKTNGGITINHRAGKLNLFGNYDYANNKTFQDLAVNRENKIGDEQFYLNQKNTNTTVSRNYDFKAGLDYYPDDKSVLGFMVSGFVNKSKSNAAGFTAIGKRPMSLDSLIKANNTEKRESSSLNYDLNYKRAIDTTGKQLTVDFVFSRFDDNGDNIYNNGFFNANGAVIKDPASFKSINPSVVNIYAAAIDYTHPLNKRSKLEMGIKSSRVTIANEFTFGQLIENSWEPARSLSDHFKYNENINSAYLNLDQDFKSTQIQIGLRAEQTSSKGDSKALEKLVNRNYLNLFPSLSINQTLAEKNTIGFVYSRRIDRPNYASLNPFVAFADLYTYNKGNPFLAPQYTNSFEFSYTYDKKLNMTLGYSRTDNVMSPALFTDAVNNKLFLTTLNLDKQNFFSFTLTLPLVITKWWTAYNYLGLYYSKFNGKDLTGISFNRSKTSFQLNTSHSFTIDKTASVELSGDYQYTHVYGTYIIKPLYGVDFGLSRSFSDNRMKLKFAANDIFNLRKANISSAIANQSYQLDQKNESRIFRLTLSYKLGSSTTKAAREHSRSSAAEELRTGH